MLGLMPLPGPTKLGAVPVRCWARISGILTPLLDGYVVLIFEYTKSLPATLDDLPHKNETFIHAKLRLINRGTSAGKFNPF